MARLKMGMAQVLRVTLYGPLLNHAPFLVLERGGRGGQNERERPAVFTAGRSNAPAMTYSRARRTTMGPGCLTAVFGMGTGVAIQVSSPESCLG